MLKKYNKIRIFFFLSVFFFCTSCAKVEKNVKLKQFEKFVINVEHKLKTYTDVDWQKLDKEYSKYCSFFEDEKIKKILTTDEKKELANLKGRYQGLRLKYKAKEKIKDVFDWINEKEKFIEGFVEGLGDNS